MTVLLDTHIWLWSLLEPNRLSPKVAAALANPDTERWLSPLSAWEALLLIERQRLEVDRPGEAWVREALERAPITDAPITREVAIVSRGLKSTHRDPVDRFLVATAIVFDLTFITADATLLNMKDVKLLPNTASRNRPRKTTRQS